MNRMTLIALLAATSTVSFAQAPPPMPTAPRVAQRAVQDPSMVIGHNKGAIEVLAAHRAAPVSAKHGRTRVQIMKSTKSDTIGPDRLGVVYNHGLKAQGYINGEIAFQLKRGATDGAFDPASYPGLKKITDPNVYSVMTRTPTEFVEVTRQLRERADVEWVEPMIDYSLEASANR